MSDQNFETFFSDALRESLASLVGPSAEVLCSEVDPGLALKQPRDFVLKLQTIMGRPAAEAIVRSIEQSFRDRLGVNVNPESAEFPKFVKATRKVFAEQRFAKAFSQALRSGRLASG